MIKKNKFVIKKLEEGQRLDVYLKNKDSSMSRSAIQKLVKEESILINQWKSKPSYILKKDDEVILTLLPKNKEKLQSTDLDLSLIYEDSDVLVLDKPAGLVVHPGSGHRNDTLVNAVLKRIDFGKSKSNLRPGIVHRLDKDTSGVLIVARNEKAYDFLVGQFKNHKVIKKYLALVQGKVRPKKGIIDAPIGRNPKDRQKMAVLYPNKGKEALTKYKVIDYFDDLTLLEIEPRTGRTHQIRVHLSSIGYPIVGDKLYGSRKSGKLISRQFLHAFYLEIKIPSGQIKKFESKLPPDLEIFLSLFR